jgi:hypothetical protein
MLWIDDDAYEMAGVANGFIKYANDKDQLDKKVQHTWLKLGNYYEKKRSHPIHELDPEAEKLLEKIEIVGSNDMVNDQREDEVIQIVRERPYDVVAIDLVLWEEDIPLKEKPEMLSMCLYKSLNKLKDKQGSPTVILYSSFVPDAELDEQWILMYNKINKTNIDPLIYARKSISSVYARKNDKIKVSELRAKQLINDILGGNNGS